MQFSADQINAFISDWNTGQKYCGLRMGQAFMTTFLRHEPGNGESNLFYLINKKQTLGVIWKHYWNGN